MTAYESANFRVDIQHRKKHVILRQYIKNPVINTRDIPSTYTFLEKHLPTIFENLCFNDEKLPFAEEAKNTEIGHLFEHLILEYLKLEAETRGSAATFDGNTRWDWSKHGKGTFLISILMPQRQRQHFTSAFTNAAAALESLYHTQSTIGRDQLPAYSSLENAYRINR